MTNAYIPISSVTLGSNTATVTFSGIPQSFSDLVLVVEAFTPGGNSEYRMRLNGITTTSYENAAFWGTASGVSADSDSQPYFRFFPSNTFHGSSNTLAIHHFLSYAATGKNRTITTRTSNAGGSSGIENAGLQFGNLNTTNGVSSILCYLASNSFGAGSTFSLFGIVG